MSRNFKISPNEFYHLYNRGTDKRIVFKSKADYSRFIKLLYICNQRGPVRLENMNGQTDSEFFSVSDDTLIDIGAFCLMPNHFHLLIREKTDNGASKFMQKLTTGYTMYFNTRYQRTGALFEGTYKAKHANTDDYLKYLFAYIHLNPIKLLQSDWKEFGINDTGRAEDFLNKYHFSSYSAYTGIDQPKNKIIHKDSFPDYFENSRHFKDFLNHWLKYSLV
ncbi:MAG: transposase [Candidatus Paceibacterota bacterium]